MATFLKMICKVLQLQVTIRHHPHPPYGPLLGLAEGDREAAEPPAQGM